MDHAGMDHSQMDHSAMPEGDATHPPNPGPIVDMRADMPNTRLDDPGVGLRDNGRRVLTYADLATLGGPIDRRAAAREIELHLTGHMERYIWSFNGQKFSDAQAAAFHAQRTAAHRARERHHDDASHPPARHVERDHGRAAASSSARKHTVIVQPGQRLAYEVTADALGSWAYHCHLLYHMEAGMFREVVVA